VKRLFWVAATPFVHVGHWLGLWSYKWVNVCIGARLPASFDALWQHQWYGTPIARLPDDVNLCGIRYRTSASEGTVIFADTAFAGRILFERDPHDRFADLWYVTLSGTMPAPHVRAAYAWVCAVFGDSFVKRAENTCLAGCNHVESATLNATPETK
jgi:hypothetical protein